MNIKLLVELDVEMRGREREREREKIEGPLSVE
jgi:hypothetical protein